MDPDERATRGGDGPGYHPVGPLAAPAPHPRCPLNPPPPPTAAASLRPCAPSAAANWPACTPWRPRRPAPAWSWPCCSCPSAPASGCCRRRPGPCAPSPTTRANARPAGPASGSPRPAPLPTGREHGPARKRSRAILADGGFWRDVTWSWLEPLAGGLLVAVPLSFVAYGVFGAAVQPFIWRLIDDGNWYAFIPVHSTATMLAALLLGLLLTGTGLLMAPAVLRVHARWSRRLLAASRGAQLVRRVEQLTDTRSHALDTQAAELRRIERDLHDGAQARLVALGMTLDRATRLLDTDPATARDLLLDVRRASEGALQDLRDLVHGIHPPVLADRGLGDAVRALALDSFLDVRVEARLPGRLPSPVEAAAYFAVGEALTNAAKHSGAQHIHIAIGHRDGTLRVTVTDDGHGGADPSAGTGLAGVRRRLDTFDGTLAVHSPPGGPTTLTMEIPCASS
ncbi:histidine kinase [Streptomyces harbinensis]|uniref:sensor histidine kinase n=1 Tax=Streptomyces harbinensis TaxID=1176198 RepID=UPI003397A4BA